MQLLINCATMLRTMSRCHNDHVFVQHKMPLTACRTSQLDLPQCYPQQLRTIIQRCLSHVRVLRPPLWVLRRALQGCADATEASGMLDTDGFARPGCVLPWPAHLDSTLHIWTKPLAEGAQLALPPKTI